MSTPEPQDPLDQLAAEEEAEKPPEAASAPDGNQPQSGDAPIEAQDEQPEWMSDPRFGGDPEKVWGSYKELEKTLGKQGAELGELRQFRQQVEPILQQQQPQQGQPDALPDGTPYYDLQTLQGFVENGDMTEFAANAYWADQQAKIYAYEMAQGLMGQFQQTVEPLRAAHIDRGARDTLDELNAALGDDVVARNQHLIAELIQTDREHYAHPQHGSRRLQEAVIAAEWRASQNGGTRQQPRTASGQFAARDTYVEGGSGAQPTVAGGTPGDPADRELIETLVSQPKVDEMGIRIPWAG